MTFDLHDLASIAVDNEDDVVAHVADLQGLCCLYQAETVREWTSFRRSPLMAAGKMDLVKTCIVFVRKEVRRDIKYLKNVPASL
jgi:hypothetical protein